MGIYDKKLLIILATSLIAAIICVIPGMHEFFPLNILARGMWVGDAFFHEIGHTVFNWIFGQPAIPAIFTLFGSDQAGGVSISMARKWPVQIAAYGALVYGCYFIWKYLPKFFIAAIILALLLIAVSFTRYYDVVISFMGHGGAILAGTFFLFRAVLFLGSEKIYERWLNGFFGFFLTLNNIFFSYELIANRAKMQSYSDHQAFGAMHNDFVVITQEIYGLSVTNVAVFTIIFASFCILSALVMPLFTHDQFYEYDDAGQ